MGRTLAILSLLSSASVFAQEAKPNPADYIINVHVRSSRLASYCGGVSSGSSICAMYQELKVEIDRKTYDLTSGALYRNPTVLRTGNYKGRLLKEDTKHDFEYTRKYELLLSDADTRKYEVSGEYE